MPLPSTTPCSGVPPIDGAEDAALLRIDGNRVLRRVTERAAARIDKATATPTSPSTVTPRRTRISLAAATACTTPCQSRPVRDHSSSRPNCWISRLASDGAHLEKYDPPEPNRFVGHYNALSQTSWVEIASAQVSTPEHRPRYRPRIRRERFVATIVCRAAFKCPSTARAFAILSASILVLALGRVEPLRGQPVAADKDTRTQFPALLRNSFLTALAPEESTTSSRPDSSHRDFASRLC